ncbi:Transposon TX1 putative 149 kDa protein, partial [Glycine soja]
WDMLKVDFMRYLEEFHQNGVIPRGCNSSFISLIPKVEVPNQLDDFIQFSLVVCMYKMLAKILSNRLKKVLN